MAQLFGTDGIRGYAGRDFFSHGSLVRFGTALAAWIHERYPESPSLVILSDTRISCAWVKACLTSSLLSKGITVYDAGVLPTPAAQAVLAQRKDCAAALIISASHNPFTDNGLKLVTHEGKLSTEDERRLETLWLFSDALASEAHTGFAPLIAEPTAADMYVRSVLAQFPPGLLQGLKIVLDCAYGASYEVAPCIFSQLGAEIHLLHDSPDGYNINRQCGSTMPLRLQEAVKALGADLGFAFDGDGDRVVASNRVGELKDGDDFLVLLSEHSAYAEQCAVVGTVLSNVGCERYFAQRGRSLRRAAVGDRNVARELQEQCLLLGAEPVGHVIVRDLLPSGDGVRSALRVAEGIIKSGNWDMVTCPKFPQVHRTLRNTERRDLSFEPFASLIRTAESFTEGGRVLVRYSGTEPVLRIMVEAASLSVAEKTAEFLEVHLEKSLKITMEGAEHYEQSQVTPAAIA
ncbi:TPA: phosphoglucosamine mutase [Candidatus Dependentiae bacterium]|nr:MAG: Phosphoglucosamine mutase [candidate division TM6 bacterium GW2011_GWF2_43_87]HBL98566.1 phosphoglucosamine mutase [Candidatus Dependentiae bacterium]